MTSKERSHSRYWTFEQALAWVLYRREDIVSYVGPRSSSSLSLVAMYPSSFDSIPNEIGKTGELLAALRQGDLTATGYSDAHAGERQVIPPEDWLKLRVYGARVFKISDDGKNTLYPWYNVTLQSDLIRKRWRTQSEVTSRTKYDWAAIEEVYKNIHSLHPDFSENELIIEIQGAFVEHFHKDAPSRSSLQKHIKTWS